MRSAKSVRIAVPSEPAHCVSGLLRVPAEATACCVLAHGAGADMRHAQMESLASGLAARRIATLRFQFPFTEAGRRRPDAPAVAQAAVRAAVAAALEGAPGLTLFAGGRSWGGRMTSQAQAMAPLPGVAGLVFFGFPLHPRALPSLSRADHLHNVELPMLFVHGARDALARPRLFRQALRSLSPRASVLEIAQADHAFHVPRRSGRSDLDVMEDMLDATAVWMQAWQLRPAA